MERLLCDLHIHSCLSPCGSDDMTPSNICGMAMLKGLQMIAVTDHNTARNLPAAQACAEACGLLLIPGMEITTREEVHLLGYEGDLYGRRLRVEFLDRLRDIRAFDGADQLADQLRCDRERVLQLMDDEGRRECLTQ